MSAPHRTGTSPLVKVGLLGASGRMGGWVSRLLSTEFAHQAQLISAPGRSDSLTSLLDVDVVIDFSLPEAMGPLAQLALDRSGPLPAFVIGSTGWKAEELRHLEALAKLTPVLMASNFSTGVLALLHVLRQASPLLLKLGYTPVLVEGHHRHKKDAPSGTAISLQKAISPENPSSVQTHSIRAGEIIGDHEVTFHGTADHIALGHFAQDRSIFARGAIDVALWLAAQRQASGAPFAAGKILGMDQYFEGLMKN